MRKNQLFKIKKTQETLSGLSQKKMDEFCDVLCESLKLSSQKIYAANEKDLRNARRKNLNNAFLQRLVFDQKKLDEVITRIHSVKNLSSGVGQILEEKKLSNNLTLQKICVPIGVILYIFESRPEVIIDVSVLSLKSGNCCILKAGSEIVSTQQVLINCVKSTLFTVKLPSEIVSLVVGDRENVYKLFSHTKYIDLVVARGGYAMVQNVLKKSRIPVFCHSEGGSRIYIDRTANKKIIEKIILNSKTSNPSACNSLDTIIVHKEIAQTILPSLVKTLQRNGVTLFGDLYVRKMARAVLPASEKTWNTEFLSKTLAIKIVATEMDAIEFVSRHTNHHSEGIIAEDRNVITRFTETIDAASLFINCSPRFHDGFIYGKGSEVGIATGKLHARGPVGLSDLTTYKWIVRGNGQIRD